MSGHRLHLLTSQLRRAAIVASLAIIWTTSSANAQDIEIHIDSSVLESKDERAARRRYYDDVDSRARRQSAQAVKKERRKRAKLAKRIKRYAKKWPEKPDKLTGKSPTEVATTKLPKGEMAIQRNGHLSGKDGHIPGVFLSDFIIRMRQTSCDIHLLKELGAQLIKSKVSTFTPIKRGNHGYEITESWRSAQLCGIQCLDHDNNKSVAVYICEGTRKGSRTPLAKDPEATYYPGSEPTALPVDDAAKPNNRESEPVEDAEPEPSGRYCHKKDGKSCYSSRRECEDANGFRPGATKDSDFCALSR